MNRSMGNRWVEKLATDVHGWGDDRTLWSAKVAGVCQLTAGPATFSTFTWAIGSQTWIVFDDLPARIIPNEFPPMKNISKAILAIFCLLFTVTTWADDGWQSLFIGTDLTGWRAKFYPDSWSVVDGTIRAHPTAESS